MYYDPISAIDDPILDLLAAQRGLAKIADPMKPPAAPGQPRAPAPPGVAQTSPAPPIAQPGSQAQPYPPTGAQTPPGALTPPGAPTGVEPSATYQPPPPLPPQGAMSPRTRQMQPQSMGPAPPPPPLMPPVPTGSWGLPIMPPSQWASMVPQLQEAQRKRQMQTLHDRAMRGDQQAAMELQRLQALTAKPTAPTEFDKKMAWYGRDPAAYRDFASAGRAGTNVDVTNQFIPPTVDSLYNMRTEVAKDQTLKSIQAQKGLQNDLGRYNTMLGLMGDMYVQGVDTGGLGDYQTRVRSFFGDDTVSSAEAFRARSRDAAMDTLERFKGPTTDFEFGIAQQTVPNFSNSMEGNYMINRLAQDTAQQALKQAQAEQDYYLSGAASRGENQQDWINRNRPDMAPRTAEESRVFVGQLRQEYQDWKANLDRARRAEELMKGNFGSGSGARGMS